MDENDDLRPEYKRSDLGEGIRGKYFARYQEGTNLVLLDSDVANAFPTSEAVNEALRALLQLAQRATQQPRRRAG